jgi:hypothetical protein
MSNSDELARHMAGPICRIGETCSPAKLVASGRSWRGRRGRSSATSTRSWRGRRGRGRGRATLVAIDHSATLVRSDLAVVAASGGVATTTAITGRLRAAGLLNWAASLLRAAFLRAAAVTAVVPVSAAMAGSATTVMTTATTATVTCRDVLGADEGHAHEADEHRDPKHDRAIHSQSPKKRQGTKR